MRWGWILLGGVLSELAVFAYYIPTGLLLVGPNFFTPENATAARPLIRTLLGVLRSQLF